MAATVLKKPRLHHVTGTAAVLAALCVFAVTGIVACRPLPMSAQLAPVHVLRNVEDEQPNRNEVQWSAYFAEKYAAEPEAVLWDRTRVDLLSDTEAIEVEWAEKQYQAPGQAVWYGIVSGKPPAVLLLVKDAKAEAAHVYRCTAICAKLGIRLYVEVLPK